MPTTRAIMTALLVGTLGGALCALWATLAEQGTSAPAPGMTSTVATAVSGQGVAR